MHVYLLVLKGQVFHFAMNEYKPLCQTLPDAPVVLPVFDLAETVHAWSYLAP